MQTLPSWWQENRWWITTGVEVLAVLALLAGVTQGYWGK